MRNGPLTQVSARRVRRLAGVLLAFAGAASCSEPQDPSLIRLWTDDFEIRLTSDISPPRALERISYTIVVRDKKTQEPIANGEGRIFATNADGKSTWNGLTYGPEVGTYKTTLTFVTAGEWALGLEFRRDSTVRLQRTLDWRQTVRNEVAPTPINPPTGTAPAPVPAVPDSAATTTPAKKTP